MPVATTISPILRADPVKNELLDNRVTRLIDRYRHFLFAGVAILILMRFLPRGWFFQRLAISQPVAGSAQTAGTAPDAGGAVDGLIGQTGIAVSGLFPSGQVEIDGRRYEARVAVGTVARGEAVVVKSRSDFGLIVEAKKT